VLLAVGIPLDDGGEYVFGAYAVFFVLVVMYLGIIGMKIARIERDLTELSETQEQDS
jgi:hypothetical protein